jgi:hypothetical protein
MVRAAGRAPVSDSGGRRPAGDARLRGRAYASVVEITERGRFYARRLRQHQWGRLQAVPP